MIEHERQRLDKWLWYARIFKTRSLAAKFVAGGHVRLNKTKVTKSSQNVKPGDVLTFPLGAHVRVIKIDSLGSRRGPASEARLLYEDLAPPETRKTLASTEGIAKRDEGTGRPTKKERRQVDALQKSL